MARLRHLMGQLAPVAVAHAWRVSRDRRIVRHGKLFDGRDEMFRERLAEATVYGEYGVGDGSTLFVLTKSDCDVVAVDSSQEWAEKVLRASGNNPRLHVEVVDLGVIGDSGRPLTYEKSENFSRYIASIWNHTRQPDFVLVDGRFRVACFLYSVIHARPGTFIIVDDYTTRPHYFVMEEILTPLKIQGRQALFEVPAQIDRARAQSLLDKFVFVMD